MARGLALGARSGSPFPVRVDRGDSPSTFDTGDGQYHAVVATGDFDLLEASPEARARQVNMFEDLLVAIECRWQVLVVSEPDAVTVADRRLAEHLRTRGIQEAAFRRRVYLVLTDTARVMDRLPLRWWAALGREDGVPDPAGGARQALLRAAGAAVDQLRLMGLRPELLAGRALDRFLDAALPVALARRGASVDWTETPGSLDVEGELSRTYFVDSYPGADLVPGWLGAIADVPARLSLAVHGFKVPAGAALRLLNGRIRNLQATRMSESAIQSTGDPLAEAGLPEAIGLRRDIASNQQQAVSTAIYVTVVARDEVALDSACWRVEDAAERTMARLLPTQFQMAAGRCATLPLGVDPGIAEKLLPSGIVATLYPWLWAELQQPGGALVGFNQRSRTPVILDSFDDGTFNNANVGVFGHSGAGKTYLMKSLLMSDHERGVGAFIVDPEAEYQATCRWAKGQWVNLALGSGHSINAMDPMLATVGERDPVGDQVTDLLDLVGIMCGALTEDDRVDLDEALREVLGRRGTLTDVREALLRAGRATRVARALSRWTEGPIGDLLARPTNVALDADFVVFGLRDLKEELLPVVYFLIAQWIWARVRAAPKPRRILFDEVGLLFEHVPVRRFLVRLARRIRKYQGSLCLVTQNAGDLLSTDQGLVLATNPSILFLGAQRQAEALRLQRAFGLTDAQCDHLAHAGRGEFLLLAGEARHRIKVSVPPWHEPLLEGWSSSS